MMHSSACRTRCLGPAGRPRRSRHLRPRAAARAATAALTARVTHEVDPDSTFPRGLPGWVRLRLRDGRVLEARAPDGRGSLARPVLPEALVAKFRDNAERSLPAARVDELEHAVLALDTLADVRTLAALCRG